MGAAQRRKIKEAGGEPWEVYKANERRRAKERRRWLKEAGGKEWEELRARERASVQRYRNDNPDWLAKKRKSRHERRQRLGKPWKSYTVGKARARGRKMGMKSTITVADIYWPTHCPVLGIQLFYPERNGEVGRPRPDLPSLDRWDNTKGYVPGNVYVVSMRANALKNDATAAELRKIADYAEWGANSLFGRPAHAT